MRPGGESLGYSEAVEAVAELADLEALSDQLSQNRPGSTLDDVDVDMLERRLGGDAVADLQALRDLERELEQQGFLTRTDDGLRLTPRAVRRLGQTALQAGVRPDRRRRSRRPRRPSHGRRRRADRADPALGVRRRAAHRHAPYGRQRPAPSRAALDGSAAVGAGRRGLRGHRDRAADLGGGGAVRRPVVLDGGRTAAGVR